MEQIRSVVLSMAVWLLVSIGCTIVVIYFDGRVETGGPRWYYAIILSALAAATWSLYNAFEWSKKLKRAPSEQKAGQETK